jgi:hypothetical protein
MDAEAALGSGLAGVSEQETRRHVGRPRENLGTLSYRRGRSSLGLLSE